MYIVQNTLKAHKTSAHKTHVRMLTSLLGKETYASFFQDQIQWMDLHNDLLLGDNPLQFFFAIYMYV